jgi:hypothetical protein
VRSSNDECRWSVFTLGVHSETLAARVVLGAALGAAMTWASFGGGSSDASAERRALEQRTAELAVRTLAPGSPLACLDALAGENVETACEKAIFASPASVATATSYVAARLALLSEIAAYIRRGGAGIDALPPLRRALEADRFGILAHVLVMRDGCTSENCKALALLRDPGQVRANLSGETFKHYLEHYLPVWAKASDGQVAGATQVQTTATAQVNPPGTRKVTVNIDFPSAASIPAVNIMNPEAKGPVLPGVAAAAAANPNPEPAAPPSFRRSHKQAAKPPAQAGVQAAPSGRAAPVEPVRPDPVPPPPSSSAPSAAAAPVQLNPFASPSPPR